MNGEGSRESTPEEQAHVPIHEQLNTLRKRIGELEDKVKTLEAAHYCDHAKNPVPDRKY